MSAGMGVPGTAGGVGATLMRVRADSGPAGPHLQPSRRGGARSSYPGGPYMRDPGVLPHELLAFDDDDAGDHELVRRVRDLVTRLDEHHLDRRRQIVNAFLY